MYYNKYIQLNVYFQVYSSLFHEFEPELLEYFDSKGVTPELYSLEWFLTLFAKNAPIELEYRILDRYFSEKEVTLYKCAIGYLKMYKNTFFELDLGPLLELLKNIPSDIDVDKYFRIVDDLPITTQYIQSLCIKMFKK